MNFGLAIPDHLPKFLQVALKHNLGNLDYFKRENHALRCRVTAYINQLCRLPSGRGLIYAGIHSQKADVLLLMRTNYWVQMPKGKKDVVVHTIKKVFSLPDDAQPMWYLEPENSNEFWDSHELSGKSSISTTT